jgi:hypothetical protein
VLAPSRLFERITETLVLVVLIVAIATLTRLLMDAVGSV